MTVLPSVCQAMPPSVKLIRSGGGGVRQPLTEAVEAVLAARAAGSSAGRRGSRKQHRDQQPEQHMPSTLIGAACACALALTCGWSS
jgi:hypothetical protein